MSDNFTESDIDQIMSFSKASSQACTERGQAYSFNCPICGEKAQAEKSSYNGHLHAHCPGCGFGVMQ